LKEGGVSLEVVRVDAAKFDEVRGYDLLIVGSPTQTWNASKPTKTFLDRLENVEGLSGDKAIAFDTKMRSRLAGSANAKIEGKLRSLELTIVKRHAAAIVEGRDGLLEESGEETFKRLGGELAKMV
jgi:multimeric flavodoxin WrbA